MFPSFVFYYFCIACWILMTGKSFVKALHLWFQSVFINIDNNLTALFNQIKTNWRNVREYRKANHIFEINFVSTLLWNTSHTTMCQDTTIVLEHSFKYRKSIYYSLVTPSKFEEMLENTEMPIKYSKLIS
jgi:hypothetical protein